jgi:hypothetical protein
VRRVGGYAAIDQGRNQMATDVLLDGYEETMWIAACPPYPPLPLVPGGIAVYIGTELRCGRSGSGSFTGCD